MMDIVKEIVKRVAPISSYWFLPTQTVQVLSGDGTRKAVLVTGCDTGLGFETALRLGRHGFHVIATCLTEAGEQKLLQAKGTEDVMDTVLLDVRDVAQIWEVYEVVERLCPQGLFAVINNAGKMEPGPIEWTSVDSMRDEMEINYFGLVQIAKTFIPLLRKYGEGSRFIAITSMIGLMPHLPGLAGYSASKHAADSFVNCLRAELRMWGIKVINVNPGTMKTPFLEDAEGKIERAWENSPLEVHEAYGKDFFSFFMQRVQQVTTYLASNPDDCIEEILHATTSVHPKTRYYCGLDARLLGRWFVHSPDWVYDNVFEQMFSVGRPAPAGLSLMTNSKL